MEQIWSSACEQANAVRQREVSASELVWAHLAHIDSTNPSINAIVQIDAERAVAHASQIDRRLQDGQPVGPLAGVPFTAKDNLESAGIVTAIGVPERRQVVPDRDATVIHRMKSAGAILLGKTNLPPWGGGVESSNDVYGRTNNPYDLQRTPGGSSGGEASAIASGMSAMGLGTDSGGSLRYPAHFCGIAAIKPTAGLVPLTGARDNVGQFGALRDPRTQVGPMARSASDLLTMLRVIHGPDNLDPAAVPRETSFAESGSFTGLRVALQLSNGEMRPTLETIEAVEAAGRVLTDLGAIVEPVELPDEGMALTLEIWRSAGSEMRVREFYEGPVAAWDVYRSQMLEWFQSFDLLLRPVNATPAVPHGDTDLSALFTVSFNLTGWPAGTVRAGTSPEGLPIGVQVVAHPWRDALVINACCALEQTLGGWQRPGNLHSH